MCIRDRCNYCAPCSVGIQIPSVFLFAGYLQRYDLEQWARDRYSTLKVKASACIGCGKCEPRCPYPVSYTHLEQKIAQCAMERMLAKLNGNTGEEKDYLIPGIFMEKIARCV